MAQALHTIALVGNPNSGKSSLFNALTGLRQKVGNFPGVTVDKKTGYTRLGSSEARITDLPGTYSLYPKSADELVTCEVLLNPHNNDRPNAIIIITDAANLRRNLLFASQIMDLRLPVVIALTMMDIARQKGIVIDTAALERRMGVPVVPINPRKNKGIAELKKAVGAVLGATEHGGRGRDFLDVEALVAPTFSPVLHHPGLSLKEEGTTGRALQRTPGESDGAAAGSTDEGATPGNSQSTSENFVQENASASANNPNPSLLAAIRQITGTPSPYAALHVACSYAGLHYLSAAQRIRIGALLGEAGFQKSRIQAEEILQRYQIIGKVVQACVSEESPMRQAMATERIDKTLLHPLWGNLILLAVLFLLFQSIFWLAAIPMDWIESGFALLGRGLAAVLPAGWVADVLINGVLAGLSGIAIFIPQIMILFGAITLLEDTGYMARISFLTDRLMRSVGLNGRSVMPLISGMACAVPAVMAARTIQNRKERLITIMVTPLMSCSARLPVYTILIALVVPDKNFLHVFSLHGLVLMGLYLLGFVGALAASKVLSLIIRIKERSYFLMEMPVYRAPRWKNVGITMLEKARIFITDAGKVIMVISLILWALSTFGPPARMQAAEAQVRAQFADAPLADGASRPLSRAENPQFAHAIQSARLEASFAGILGHAIEPAIRPLGYDWKIGIALITSFAAREVFVGTMATLYSVGDAGDDDRTLREKMRAAKRPDGTPVYTAATGISLVVFYVFAMQCMSTLAVVKRETRSWKWPLIQFAYMLALAWGAAWLAYVALR